MKKTLTRLLLAFGMTAAIANSATAVETVNSDYIANFRYGIQIAPVPVAGIPNTLGAEAFAMAFNFATLTITASYTNQRDVRLVGPTVNGVFTITTSATLSLTAPVAGTSTLTNNYAVLVESGNAAFRAGVLGEHFDAYNSAANGATLAAGTGCNTSSALSATGSDAALILTFTCGGTGATSATVIDYTFITAYTNVPVYVCQPNNVATVNIAAAQTLFVQPTATDLIIKSNTTGLAAGTYSYQCLGMGKGL